MPMLIFLLIIMFCLCFAQFLNSKIYCVEHFNGKCLGAVWRGGS